MGGLPGGRKGETQDTEDWMMMVPFAADFSETLYGERKQWRPPTPEISQAGMNRTEY